MNKTLIIFFLICSRSMAEVYLFDPTKPFYNNKIYDIKKNKDISKIKIDGIIKFKNKYKVFTKGGLFEKNDHVYGVKIQDIKENEVVFISAGKVTKVNMIKKVKADAP